MTELLISDNYICLYIYIYIYIILNILIDENMQEKFKDFRHSMKIKFNFLLAYMDFSTENVSAVTEDHE